MPLATERKRPVNLTLPDTLVEQTRLYSNNLSATVEELLRRYVQEAQTQQTLKRQEADMLTAQWNAFTEQYGSFADEYRNF